MFDALTAEEAEVFAKDLTSAALEEELVAKIYVQTRNSETDKFCKIAKDYYDALSDDELAKFEECDYGDYYAITGDASLDDARNADGIGAKELLVVSFGTSFTDSRVATIKAVGDALAAANPDYSVRRAFTAQVIINHIQSRDGYKIDNMRQALDRAVANGVKELVVQPTHLMHGYEYDEMIEDLDKYKENFDIIISEPLLSSAEDKTAVAEAVVAQTIADNGGKVDDSTAIVFMGHGTSHEQNVTYTQMQEVFSGLGYQNVFVGTVEGKPGKHCASGS
jgi:cobalamin biosynthesis Co2+ chelatase CbiK